MPTCELHPVAELKEDYEKIISQAGLPCACFHVAIQQDYLMICSKARDAWAFTFCNTANETALSSYFSYHMKMVSYLLGYYNRHPEHSHATLAYNGLANHLYEEYGHLIKFSLFIPTALWNNRVQHLSLSISKLQFNIGRLEDPALGGLIKDTLNHWLSPHGDERRTIGSLAYLERFIMGLSSVVITCEQTCSQKLIDQLMILNFNSIEFFLFLEDRIRMSIKDLPFQEQIASLRRELQLVRLKQANCGMAYTVCWKSITEMVTSWIMEEIILIEEAENTSAKKAQAVVYAETAGLNLSVAQLACLIKALFKSNVYASGNLKEIFAFHAQVFHSKRQVQLSRGNLSKEYYSITQKTAAVVIALLQKMIAVLKHDYFPVILAAILGLLPFVKIY